MNRYMLISNILRVYLPFFTINCQVISRDNGIDYTYASGNIVAKTFQSSKKILIVFCLFILFRACAPHLTQAVSIQQPHPAIKDSTVMSAALTERCMCRCEFPV